MSWLYNKQIWWNHKWQEVTQIISSQAAASQHFQVSTPKELSIAGLWTFTTHWKWKMNLYSGQCLEGEWLEASEKTVNSQQQWGSKGTADGLALVPTSLLGNTSVLHLLLQTVLLVKPQFVQINLLCKNCLRQPALVYQVGELAPQEPRTWRWPETRRADAAVHEGQIGKCATHLHLKKLPPLTGSNLWKKSGKIKHGGFSILDYHPNFTIQFFL